MTILFFKTKKLMHTMKKWKQEFFKYYFLHNNAIYGTILSLM